jgi:hypothetical protein
MARRSNHLETVSLSQPILNKPLDPPAVEIVLSAARTASARLTFHPRVRLLFWVFDRAPFSARHQPKFAS